MAADQATTTPGLGLSGIRERLRIVDGELTIDSRIAEGTELIVRIPLPATVPPR